jgi:hypothetical protein
MARRPARSRPARSRRGRSRRLRWAAWALGLTVAGAALFTLYLSQSLTVAISSDGAANVLQGQALDHGNLLLRGWWTSDVSFYSTELPEYAFVTALRGVSPDVVHICGALTCTLTVLLAALLARGRASGSAGRYQAGITAGILLAPSVLGGTQVFLENPDHAGTAVPVLALLLLLDWGRLRWSGPAACALLALTELADPLSLAAVTVPLALACVIRLVAAAVRRRPRAEFRDDGLLLAAAALSAGLASLATRVIRSHGGFDVPPVRDTLLVPFASVPANARTLWQSLVLLFGANNPGTPHQPFLLARHEPLVLMADLHVIGLVLAVAGLAAGIVACVRGRADRVTFVLVAAIGVLLAAGVFTQLMRSLANAHEVAILAPLGAALAGRTLPPLVAALSRRLAPAWRDRVSPAWRDRVSPAWRDRVSPAWRDRVSPAWRDRVAPGWRDRVAHARGRAGRLAALALAAWLALGLAELCYAAAWPAGPSPAQAVAAWLVAHHEHEGLAGYWQADVITVTSGGRVLVAPVISTATRVDRWESSAGWYRPGVHRATFVIAVPGPAAPDGALTVATVRARFGPPAARYQVGGEIIMTYRRNLLARLDNRAFPGAS